MDKCGGKTPTGRPCGRKPQAMSSFCSSHAPKANNITTTGTHRSARRIRQIRECWTGSAGDAIGELEPGCEIFGFTKGQFSLLDLILALLERTGPADVTIATWTAANAHIKGAEELLNAGEIRSIRWIVDRSFPTRQPAYLQQLVASFGLDSIRVTNTHAKFVIIANERWNLAIRTSMNLNGNKRFEDFEISDDPLLAGYLQTITDEIYTNQEAGEALNGEASCGFDEHTSDREVAAARCLHCDRAPLGRGQLCFVHIAQQ